MFDYLHPILSDEQLRAISALGLAHIGDGVYELLFRTYFCEKGLPQNGQLHAYTVKQVSASAQAKAIDKLIPILTADELSVYKRGRNSRVNSVPHGCSIAEYHAATGLETLFGWLYLKGCGERINELFQVITEDNHAD